MFSSSSRVARAVIQGSKRTPALVQKAPTVICVGRTLATVSRRTLPRYSTGLKATAALLAGVTCAACVDANTQVDENTGVAFPKELAPDTTIGAPHEVLLGTGCRYKYGFMKMYAVGVYVDDVDAIRVLAPQFKGQTSANLSTVPQFYDALMKTNLPMTFLVKTCRGLSNDQLVGALYDCVKERVSDKKEMEHADSFRKLLASGLNDLKSGEVPAGTEVKIMWTSTFGGVVTVLVNDKLAGSVRSQELERALFDTYLGSHSICSGLRSDMYRGFVTRILGNSDQTRVSTVGK